MPLYDYSCPAGHKYEAIRSRDVEMEPCACGLPAVRAAVYPVSEGHHWASEFQFNSSMRMAHEEAKGYLAEARTVLAEERANGLNA